MKKKTVGRKKAMGEGKADKEIYLILVQIRLN